MTRPNVRLYNNALQLTRGASEASGLRRTHHCLVPPAAERECWADVLSLRVTANLEGRGFRA